MMPLVSGTRGILLRGTTHLRPASGLIARARARRTAPDTRPNAARHGGTAAPPTPRTHRPRFRAQLRSHVPPAAPTGSHLTRLSRAASAASGRRRAYSRSVIALDLCYGAPGRLSRRRSASKLSLPNGKVLPQNPPYPGLGGDIGPHRVREYAASVRPHYRLASRRENGRLLDEFCRITKRDRKVAIRLLRRRPKRARARMGRPRTYVSTTLRAPLEQVAGSPDRPSLAGRHRICARTRGVVRSGFLGNRDPACWRPPSCA